MSYDIMQSGAVQARVALLIDADNISEKYADDLFNKAAVYGHIIIRNGYGTLCPGGFRWKKYIIHKYAIKIEAVYTHVSGKNVADIALVIDAMDIMQRKIADVVCIASNDSDFSLLAATLRQNGMKVYGFGGKQAHTSFVRSCDKFEYIDIAPDNGSEEHESTHVISDNEEDKSVSGGLSESIDISKIVSDAYDEYSDDDRWADLAPIGSYLIRINPAFSSKNYGGHNKLIDLIYSLDEYEVHQDKERLSTKIKKKEK